MTTGHNYDLGGNTADPNDYCNIFEKEIVGENMSPAKDVHS